VQTLCAFRLGEPPRSIWTLTLPVGRTVQPRVFQLAATLDVASEEAPPRNLFNPGLVSRLPVKAHGFSAQNVFDWFDLYLAIESGQLVKIMNENDLIAGTPLPLV